MNATSYAVATNLVVGLETMIYSGYHDNYQDVSPRLFLPVRDLIHDARDPQVMTLEVQGKDNRWKGFEPAIVSTEINNGPMFELSVESESGLTDGHKPVISGAMHVIAEDIGTVRLSKLVERQQDKWRLRLLTYSFSQMTHAYADVVVTKIYPASIVKLEALRRSYHIAHDWTVLEGGIIISR